MDINELKTLIDSMASKKSVDDILAKIDGLDKRLATLGEEPKKEPATDAVLGRAGALDSIMSFKAMDVPVGKIVVAGGIAVLGTELIDGFMGDAKPMTTGLVKLALAAAAVKWGAKFLGKDGAEAVALLIGYDGIRDILPIDTYVKKLANKITGTVTNAGLAQNANRDRVIKNNVMNQANKVAADYYKGTGV